MTASPTSPDLTSPDLTGRTAVVTGASRGFGLGISVALAAAGAHVVGVARAAGPLHALGERLGASFTPVTGDAADPAIAEDLVRTHRPSVLVLNAGAVPPMAPFTDMSWDDFSHNWRVDTRHAFHWAGAAITTPLAPDSVVVTLSSGAALHGSPVSGGYAGAKAAVRFISSYAAAESTRLGLGLRFVTLLPSLTPATDFGTAAVTAYADRRGDDLSTVVAGLRPFLTPEQVGREVVRIVADPATPAHAEYLLSENGREVVPR
jgi:NAD(P)-dependent dehydrogenase (short-subunit alcohol dehydrogenase family)